MPADKEPTEKPLRKKMKGAFASGHAGILETPLFTKDELDIYVNKITQETFIFHGKDVDYSVIDRLEYNPINYAIYVVLKDGTRQDLGVKIQWLVRPYFSKAKEINIVQTKNGESINGVIVPLVHKLKK